MNRTIQLSLLGFTLVAAVACGRKAVPPSEQVATSEASEHAPEASNRLPLEGVRGLRFIQVPEARTEGSWYPAEAIGDESAQALLTAPVKGIVSAIAVAPGTRVGPGARLLVLQSPELARLKADWLSAKARRASA
ncbi:MAG: hypothetical protein JST38_09760, partial [Bacteroidetes bacterium]|nr:hypothetical protein [Bacteroidota bacterium]